jgi:carbon-monoxide dehydrogenase small subunit
MSIKPVTITLHVNGQERRTAIEPRTTLVDALRDNLGLVGTHVGCEHGVCGACTVLLDGRPVRSCCIFAVQVDGQAITTVEGLAPARGEMSPLQDAFCEKHALQCGYCTPGMLVACHALLQRTSRPNESQIREAISGNLCRCTGYQQIVEAVQHAAEHCAVNATAKEIARG